MKVVHKNANRLADFLNTRLDYKRKGKHFVAKAGIHYFVTGGPTSFAVHWSPMLLADQEGSVSNHEAFESCLKGSKLKPKSIKFMGFLQRQTKIVGIRDKDFSHEIEEGGIDLDERATVQHHNVPPGAVHLRPETVPDELMDAVEERVKNELHKYYKEHLIDRINYVWGV